MEKIRVYCINGKIAEVPVKTEDAFTEEQFLWNSWISLSQPKILYTCFGDLTAFHGNIKVYDFK